MPNFDYPQTLVQQETNTGVIIIPLDNFFDCRDFSIFDPNGCKTPYDPSYCFQFLPSDTIYIQTNFTASVIEFFEFDGTPQTIPFTQDGKTIVIDGADVPVFVDCFYIKIDGNCTYGYQRIFCEEGTVTISSSFPEKDTLGFDYTGEYNNTLRISGGFEFLGVRHEDRANSRGQIVKRVQYDRYLLRTSALPEAIAKLALNILSGKNVQVNKQDFYNKVSLNDKTQDAKAWNVEAELERLNSDIKFCP